VALSGINFDADSNPGHHPKYLSEIFLKFILTTPGSASRKLLEQALMVVTAYFPRLM
jgi:hypothetical protein